MEVKDNQQEEKQQEQELIPIEDKKKNLKVDISCKPRDTKVARPKESQSDASSRISLSTDTFSSIKEKYVDQESLMSEQSMYYSPNCYYGYYYPGYEGPYGEMDDQGYVLSNDGLDTQYTAVQGDNGLLYYMPNYQPSYFPSNPYVPSATIGLDGQYLGHQPYYVSPMSPQPITSPGYFPTSFPYRSELSPSYIWDPSLLVEASPHGNNYLGVSLSSKPKYSVPSKLVSPKSVHYSKLSNHEGEGTFSKLNNSSGLGILNDSKQSNKTAILSKFPYEQTNGGLLYPNSPVNYKFNGRVWGTVDKLKTRSKPDVISDFDLHNEQNRGPRTKNAKGIFESGDLPAVSLEAQKNITSATVFPDQYNLPDFQTNYDQALFFVIKSYSEDDIHKSIKYNVWASTPNGNKRLDSAYQDAEDKMKQKSGKCPVFLLFSVNASGQFCGVAEMIGRVDLNKSMDFWQQDKWKGFFPVKWHFIKDVPNPHFRHIILENNDNKPVTNSRDTQELKFPQGIDMLNIFNNFSSKTSILDDFSFYESRQKAMEGKRIRPSTPRVGHSQPPQKSDEVDQLSTGLESINLKSDAKIEEIVTEVKAEE